MHCEIQSTIHERAPPRGTFYIQYETLEELGEGAFGKALKCRRRRDNHIFVVKIMHESKMSAKAIEEVMHCLITNAVDLKETPDNMAIALSIAHMTCSLCMLCGSAGDVGSDPAGWSREVYFCGCCNTSHLVCHSYRTA